MKLFKIILHGFLKDRYPAFAVAGNTPAEALEGWSRQAGLAGLAHDQMPQVQVLDHDGDKLFKPSEADELHIVPAMFGGGPVARIVVGALLIVAGTLLIVMGGPVGLAIGAALIGAGVGMFIGGIMSLFQKSPSTSKEEDPEASKYIGTGKNTVAIGTPIGFGGGRMRIGGQFLSLQVNSSDLVHGIWPATTS